MKEMILLKRRFLISSNEKNSENYAYLASKLLNTFAVVVDNSSLLEDEHLRLISDFYGIKVPSSFYKNPQDLQYFTTDELLLEQLVSYFKIAFDGGVNSKKHGTFKRVELFSKALPNYKDGTEMVLREYTIVTSEKTDEILTEICSNYADYTRPYSKDELAEFDWLYKNGYYKKFEIKGKTNAMLLFKTYKDVEFAKSLDKKDAVKLSIELVGEKKQFSYTKEDIELLKMLLSNVRNAKLTKKQAKFYNTISRKIGMKQHETNDRSPYKEVAKLMETNSVVEAAKVFSNNGSLLERNLAYLLSRSDLNQAQEIIDMIKINNPIVAIQFVNSITTNSSSRRVFKFYAKNKMKTHIETESEFEYRKSHLTVGIKKLLKDGFDKKIYGFYDSLPKLGKIYIDPSFKNVALPLNTTACGTGLDVPPVGTRLPIKDDYIRTFTYWNNAYDIDTSVNFVHNNGDINILYWGNYSNKEFGNSALTSGDCRDRNGSEYIDFKISELRDKGYKYAFYSLNGFNSNLNSGQIYTGYQNKSNLNTKAWSPKNIELKINVKGDSRAYLAFAIDFETKEIIILNQMLASGNRVVSPNDIDGVKHLMNRSYIETFNIFNVASQRGDVVEDPTEADVIFSDTYQLVTDESKQVIRSFNVEKLVSLLTK